MDTPIEKSADAEHLEALCHSFVNACNTRRLDRANPVWDAYAPTFRAEPDLDPNQKIVNLEELLAQIREVIAANPAHQIEIFSFDVKITEKTGNAHVFMTTEITGCPEGVRRQNAVIFEFRKIEGKWKAIWYRGLRGTGGLDSGFGGL
ncbi:hypothetical protein M409DRAFT_26131 [Zasmidium cellare ATCC 36951]|uniref:SnoaL-like domain-containing protein n=1 Tax=Zasmidium cellare ATCC 36951 TaxID=1080233 RepID=A0A6A6CBD2_ZASCE|nr:uncharacterized protein M409DRAFT_26131 [Zasmidium cellare ATCC 36951]KAF2163520.1 hypothetical protein M409DRAFT_26131 [Zasmidium cellare ATCC 36951]